jgi:hypothetical protein
MRKVALLALTVWFFAGAAAQAAPDKPADKASSQCRKLPPAKRILKLNIKPDSDVRDLIGWMTTITCTGFITNPQDLEGKKVTVRPEGLITLEEAQQLFVGALDSVGLVVQPPLPPAGQDAGILKIVKKPAP